MKYLKSYSSILFLSLFIACGNESAGTESSESTDSENPTLTENTEDDDECGKFYDYIDIEMNYSAIYAEGSDTEVKGVKISFVLTNQANVTTYSNLEIHYNFMKKGAILFKEDFVISEPIAPGAGLTVEREIEMSTEDYESIKGNSQYVNKVDC